MEDPRTGLSEGRFAIAPDVVWRAFGDETVLLNLKSGQYHALNPTAGRMLELLDELGDSRAVAERITEEFDAPLELVRRDVAELCDQLLERGLLAVLA